MAALAAASLAAAALAAAGVVAARTARRRRAARTRARASAAPELQRPRTAALRPGTRDRAVRRDLAVVDGADRRQLEVQRNGVAPADRDRQVNSTLVRAVEAAAPSVARSSKVQHEPQLRATCVEHA